MIGIIIPVFNRPQLVREAIESALGEASEIIVVDDCSTDETWDVIRSFGAPVRAIRMPKNGGQSAARNAGFDVARGKYVKFLDSDDVLIAGHLTKELQRAEAESADLVVSGWRADRDEEAPVFGNVIDDILAGKAVPTSAALYLRATAVRWDPALRKLDDWDYFCQAALGAEKIAREPGLSYWMREHGGERATNVSMLANASEHHAILSKIEKRLEAEGTLTVARRKRLAQYYYKEIRVLCLNDRDAFEAAVRHIDELDPQFRPIDEERQWWMRVIARVLGARRAVLLHSTVKRLLR
jgi:hypothetical protein